MNEFQEYGSVAVGLLIGTLARFGQVIAGGELPTWRHVIGFLLQLGLIGLIAMVATAKLGIHDADMRALTTAVLAISAQEVIQYIKRSGWQYLAHSAIPSTFEGERRQEEQKARAARKYEEEGRLDEAFERVAEKRARHADDHTADRPD